MDKEKILDNFVILHNMLMENEIMSFNFGEDEHEKDKTVALKEGYIHIPYNIYMYLRDSECEGDIINEDDTIIAREMEYKGLRIGTLKFKED